jgi:hypothetical protein
VTVTLLALGAQPSPPTAANAVPSVGAAVDVSTLAVMRLDIDTVIGLTDCDLTIYFEHGPTSSGPWAPLTEVKQSSCIAPKKHVVLSGFDSFVRIRWLALRYGWSTSSFQLGVYGSGVAGTVS